MRQATNIQDFAHELVLPGISMNTAATDFFTFDQVQISRFDGKSWKAGSAPIKIAGIKTD